jgi:NADH:ubiquinone oxidoreductase subunit E
MDDDCPACHACECHIRETKKIRDAAIEVLKGAYSDDEYIDARALEDLRNAIGISIEELREEE